MTDQEIKTPILKEQQTNNLSAGFTQAKRKAAGIGRLFPYISLSNSICNSRVWPKLSMTMNFSVELLSDVLR